jgi:hypothetical protein
MNILKQYSFSAILIGVLLLASSPSYGIPAFARKYQMECTMCHEPVPRLNEYGYKFRAAGFRRPEEIGKGEASSDYSDYIAARVMFAATDKSTAGSDNNTSVDQSGQTNIGFQSASIYPLCGAFGAHISAWSEFGYTPGAGNGTINIGNAWMRFTYGDTASFWSVRVGVFSFIEGYGASDAGIGVSSNLIKSAGQTWIGPKLASSLYTPGTGEAGIEVGWNLDRLSLHVGVGNGGYVNNGAFQAAIGGNANKPANSPSYNAKDLMFFGNYMLDEHGGDVGAYYFMGSLDFTNPLVAGAAAMFPDNYMRYGVYAGTPTFSGFKLYGGLSLGSDKEWAEDTTILPDKGKVADSTTASMGYFFEPDFRIDKEWSVGARYDFFDPLTGSNYKNNEINAISAFCNYCMNNGLTFMAEVQQKTTLQGVDATNTALKKNDYSLTLRTYYIW